MAAVWRRARRPCGGSAVRLRSGRRQQDFALELLRLGDQPVDEIFDPAACGALVAVENVEGRKADARLRQGDHQPFAAHLLFDENGRVRLPPGSSAAAKGDLPPGVVEQEIKDLDRAGTWLKRKNPLPYEPTAFDRYWLPGGTLLEEWVRKGIKQTEIPIPGTSKKIHCVISILQLGGGCYVTDPNMQDQEATARPPPDIPWKPELQEDQDSLEKPSQP